MGRCLAVALAALLSVLAGCGGDDSDGYVEDPKVDARSRPLSNAPCRTARGHPVRVSAEPLESVVACSSRNGRSVRLRNGSSQVLRVRPDDLYDRTNLILITRRHEPPGIDAAHSTTGGGMDARRESLVLPLGSSMIARGNTTVSLTVEGDPDLTVAANVARYFAEWIASELPVRGEQLTRPVRPCARSVQDSVDESGFVEDALRRALDTRACRQVMDDVAVDNGLEPAAERPKARTAILRRARGVLRDRLLPRRTTILAAR